MLNDITNKNTVVLIAALKEEKGVGLTIEELSRYPLTKRILVIDGHSIDRTVEVAKNLGAEIILQSGIGKGDAIAQAIASIEDSTEYVVLTDADFTYPAESLPEMIEILAQNPQVGMVCGNRLTDQVDGKALHTQFYLGNKMLAFAHGLLNNVELKDPLTGLRVVRAQVLRDWKVKSKGFDIEVELNAQVQKQGYTIAEIPIKYRPRVGEKKLKMKQKHGAGILKRIILETAF
jgi:dolichol-phosphate hexosyltransferase